MMINGLSFILFAMVNGEAALKTTLTKPYTLKIVASMPITGQIMPMGDMCLGPMQIALDIANNRSDILPQYNLVVDIIDDQCNGGVGLQRSIDPYFLNKQRIFKHNDSKIGQFQIPEQFLIVEESAKTFYVPPIFGGSICSGVCQLYANMVKKFKTIQVSLQKNRNFMNLNLISVCRCLV